MKYKYSFIVILLASITSAALADAPLALRWHAFGEPSHFEQADTQTHTIPIDLAQGTLEFQFKPHDGAREPREVLTLVQGPDFHLTLRFAPSGNRWIVQLNEKQGPELVIWHNLAVPGQWNHVALTWSDTGPEGGRMELYANGRWRDGLRYAGRGEGQATLTLGHADQAAEVSFRDWALYGRAWSESQIESLASLEATLEARLGPFAVRVREDDEKHAARLDALASLKGKVGYLVHRKGTEPRTIDLPEGIVAESIRPEDLGTIQLDRFAVIFFPSGPRYQLDTQHDELIRDYVRSGGGYVGSCQGSYYAAQLGLLDMQTYALNIWGLFKVRLTSHVLTDFREEEISMHFGNGPVMVPGEGCEVVATYVMTLPGKASPAAIVTGTYGSGRVVAFGPHPEGGTVSAKGTRAHWSGALLDTDRMLANALLYASGKLSELP